MCANCVQMKKPTILIFLDSRRNKQNTSKYPVKLRITYQRLRKYYPTGIDLTKEEFVQVKEDSPPKPLRGIKNDLKGKESAAINIINDMKHFNWNTFEARFGKPKADIRNVYSTYEDYIKKFEKKGSGNTASIYRTAMISLRKFQGKLFFDDVTPEFLQKYEKWFLEKGNAKATLGMYIRTLRTLINIAIEDSIFPRENYPFSRRKYRIPTGNNIKKALKLDEIKKIIDYVPDEYVEGESRAKDYWLFSYFGNGINIKDISRLKYQDIHGDFIEFERAKTEGSSRQNPRKIRIFLLPQIIAIINKRGNKDKSPDNFVFPILWRGITPIEERKAIKNFTRLLNKFMKRIAKKIGIETPCTTYYARHSFATVLKRSGASIEFISERLGHSDTKTTEIYLDGFEDETVKEMAQKLIPA